MSLFFQWWGKVYVSGRAAGGRCAGAARAGAAGGGGAGEHLLRRVSEVQDLEGLRLELLQLGPQDVDVAVHGVTRPLLHQPPEQLVLEQLLLEQLEVQLVVEVVLPSISSRASTRSRTSKVSDSRSSSSPWRPDSASEPVPLRISVAFRSVVIGRERDRKSTRLNSSHVAISYAVFGL